MQNIQQSFFSFFFHPANNVFVPPKMFVNLGEFYVWKKVQEDFSIKFYVKKNIFLKKFLKKNGGLCGETHSRNSHHRI